METKSQVFDEQDFLERVGGDYELAADVARLFLEDCPRRLAAMRDALAKNDPATLRAEAHGLKGASGNMSAVALSALARDVEEQVRQNHLDAAVATFLQLEEQSEVVLAAVRVFEAHAAAR